MAALVSSQLSRAGGATGARLTRQVRIALSHEDADLERPEGSSGGVGGREFEDGGSYIKRTLEEELGGDMRRKRRPGMRSRVKV